MSYITEIVVSPEDINSNEKILVIAKKKLRLPKEEKFTVQLLKRSIDARKKTPKFLLKVRLLKQNEANDSNLVKKVYKHVSGQKAVIIVGAGPAGYFAALKLLEKGLKPIVLERGKDVQERRKDLRNIQQLGIVNPHSNYCFGEGGAGTYSDGKLYTRSTKRGNVQEILEILVEHGATPDILIDAHPHIGSNKLPEVIKSIREAILSHGGEIHFDSFVTDFILQDSAIKGVRTELGKEYLSDQVILATGHSARDIYELCDKKNILVEAKPFAMGVRIEHPQPLIDEIQYRQKDRHINLPAASYSLVCQTRGRGVFSFCMCPGGIIVPAATAPGETVVNGMSLSRRDSPFANSGLVVQIDLEDLSPYKKHDAFAGLQFQKDFEKMAFKAGGDETQKAPSQRIVDFVRNRQSSDLPETSYIPGVESAPLHELIPKPMRERLQISLQQFSRNLKGYYTNEAQIVGVESRTSSPVRIPRHKESFEHTQIEGLYPCAEGAGYAGGIISAAIDGQNVAISIAEKTSKL